MTYVKLLVIRRLYLRVSWSLVIPFFGGAPWLGGGWRTKGSVGDYEDAEARVWKLVNPHLGDGTVGTSKQPTGEST